MDRDQLEAKIIEHLKDQDLENSLAFVNYDHQQHQLLVGAIKSLEVAYMAVSTPGGEHTEYTLTPEGRLALENGSHEVRFFNAIDAENGSNREELLAQFGQLGKIAMGACMKNKWIKQNGPLVVRQVDSVVDQTQNDLQLIADKKYEDGNKDHQKIIADLRKRKLIVSTAIKYFTVKKGPEYSSEKKVIITDLTRNVLRNGEWKDAHFKEFNFNAEGKVPRLGALHPIQKIKIEFTKILTSMGFQEMPTSQYVESSFWNFDALYQPQQHPARDAHDTFFLTTPESCDMDRTAPRDYIERVKQTHEVGGYGSTGLAYTWDEKEAAKNILRTHTTSCSSRVLYQIAQEYQAKVKAAQEKGEPIPEFEPRRYFSIDRVFRNETLDATHLAEFQQVEGMVVGKDITLGHLIGVIKTFFSAIGVDDVRFKPAFNPYTEPSMEIFGFSKDLDRWIEIGNSGMFRPEMVAPMGLPDGVRVIAWGLSLERPTMIKYGLNNIRELVGPRMQLEIIENNHIARYP